MKMKWTVRAAIVLGAGLAAAGCAHRVAPPPPSSEGADVSNSRQKAYEKAVAALHKWLNRTYSSARFL